MTETRTFERDIGLAVQRAAAYELLARCFAYPNAEALEGMRSVAAIAGEILGETPLGAVLRAIPGSDPDELAPTHASIFTLSSSPDFPTFETAYVCTDPMQQTTVMADIAGFYRAFGVQVSEAGLRPDDITVELEFMGFLCRKHAYAVEHLGAPRVRQAIRVQRLFLGEHLGRWASALGERLATVDHPFYRNLGTALAEWIARDCEHVGTGPIERAPGPRMPWPKREAGGGYEPIGTQFFEPGDIPVAGR